MKDKIIFELEKKEKEIQVTKDNTEYWKGVRTGISKAISIVDDLFPKKYKSTEKTIEAEKFVDDFIIKNGYSPTYRDVAQGLNLSSTNTAYHRLRNYRHFMQRNPLNN